MIKDTGSPLALIMLYPIVNFPYFNSVLYTYFLSSFIRNGTCNRRRRFCSQNTVRGKTITDLSSFWSHELDLNQYPSILGNYPFSRS